MQVTSPRPRAVAWRFAAGALVLLLVGFAMRGPLAAPAVVAREIEAGLEVPPSSVGLVSSLPLLCFAAATPLAAYVVTRVGIDRALTITLSAIALGLVLRALGTYELLVVGTLIVGIAITLGNVAMPVFAGARIRPDRQSAFTGAYVASASIGSMSGTVGTAAVAGLAGWQAALVASAPVVVIALVGWRWWSRRSARALRAAGDAGAAEAGSPRDAAEATSRGGGRDRRWRRVTVLLSCAFSAQALLYFSITAWLPTILTEHGGHSSGTAAATASVFQIVGIAGALGIPIVVRRFGNLTATLVVSIAWSAMTAGLLLAPALAPLWLMFGGVAHAGAFVVIFGAIIQYHGHGAGGPAAMSAIVQGTGYAVASAGPVLIGAVSQWGGSWAPVLLILVCVTVLFGGCAVSAALLMRRTSRMRRTDGRGSSRSY
ncbi:CynX/NimT family MFS transporter [Microbacterium sp. 18062]|uniref:MFS transporter n=1 Tax=Microbacterium sp. 18062 TaxID=2681410 RepID=UPI001358E8B8|nr:MFS transporter [Microbacterium sp. 18062]